MTDDSASLLALVSSRRAAFDELLAKYRARNPRLFGSVVRGEADAQSDIDVLVDMDAADGNVLMRASGLREEAREVFGDVVDIVPAQLLKRAVSAQAIAEAVPL